MKQKQTEISKKQSWVFLLIILLIILFAPDLIEKLINRIF